MAQVVSRNIGPLAALKKKMERSGGTGVSGVITWVRADPGQLTVRFLTELTDFEYYQECWPVGKGRPFPLAEGLQEGTDYQRKNDMYLANALDVENDRVIALQIKPSVLASLMLKHERYGTIMDRDYTIVRYGEGLNTEYSLENEGPSKRNLAKYQLYDLSQVIQDAYDDVFGSDESVNSVKPKKKAGLTPLPRKRVQRGSLVRDDPDEDDEEEEEEEQEEDEYLYSADEMMELEWSDLRSYARERGVRNPSRRRSELIKQIQKTY